MVDVRRHRDCPDHEAYTCCQDPVVWALRPKDHTGDLIPGDGGWATYQVLHTELPDWPGVNVRAESPPAACVLAMVFGLVPDSDGITYAQHLSPDEADDEGEFDQEHHAIALARGLKDGSIVLQDVPES